MAPFDGQEIHAQIGEENCAVLLARSLLPDEVEYVVATDDGSFGHHGRVMEGEVRGDSLTLWR